MCRIHTDLSLLFFWSAVVFCGFPLQALLLSFSFALPMSPPFARALRLSFPAFLSVQYPPQYPFASTLLFLSYLVSSDDKHGQRNLCNEWGCRFIAVALFLSSLAVYISFIPASAGRNGLYVPPRIYRNQVRWKLSSHRMCYCNPYRDLTFHSPRC